MYLEWSAPWGDPGRARLRKRAQSAPRVRLALESLEDRLAPSASTIPVSNQAYELWRSQTLRLDTAESASSAAGNVSLQAMDGANLIGLDRVASDYGYKGDGYTIAVIDTGIDYRHSALGGGWGNRVIAGWDFVNNDADPLDDQGHGTHVAGIIGSSDATRPGVAPNVKFVALKVLGADGSGNFGAIEDALNWVVAHQAQYNIVAVNMSLGSGNFSVNPYAFLDDEFAQLKNQGVFLAVASGNSFYSNNSTPGVAYPGVSNDVVSVGAVWAADFGPITFGSGARDLTTAPDRITSFTQRSNSVEIFAPGALITSTYLNNQWKALAGTSMATPFVAGAAALVHQALDVTGQSSRANQAGILQILQSTGKTIVDGDDENDNVANTGLSFKRLDVFAALQSVGGASPNPNPNPNPNPSPSNRAPTLSAIPDQITHGGTLQVALQASDPDGNTLTFTSKVLESSNQVYQIKTQYGLTFAGSYFNNIGGAAEKWIIGDNSEWFCILPSGALHRWAGSFADTILPSALVAQLSPEIYDDPSLLWNATPPAGPNVDLRVNGSTLSVTPPAGYSGTFRLQVTVSDGQANATQSFQVTAKSNGSPVIEPIADIALGSRRSTTVTLNYSDADGDTLSATASIGGLLKQLASLRQQLGLISNGNYYSNAHGGNEKWLQSASGAWYGVFPNGDLRRWAGNLADTLTPANFVATLDASVYRDPALLWNSAASPSVSLQNKQLTIDVPTGFEGSFSIEVAVTDGTTTATRSFNVSAGNSAPQLTTIADRTIKASAGSVAVTLQATDADGDAVTFSAQLGGLAGQALRLKQQLGLYFSGSYYTNYYGAGEKFLRGSGDSWYFLLPNGELHRWVGNLVSSLQPANLLATFDPSYFADPSLIWKPLQPTIAVNGSTLTVTPPAGFIGTLPIEVIASDGSAQSRKSFSIHVTDLATVLTNPGPQTIHPNQGQITLPITASDPDGDALQLSAKIGGWIGRAQELQKTLGFVFAGSFHTNAHGLQEKWVVDRQGNYFAILPSGEFRRWTGTVAGMLQADALVAQLDPSVHADPQLLLVPPTPAVAMNQNQLTVQVANFVGSFDVEVAATDGTLSTTQTFRVTVTNTAPTMAVNARANGALDVQTADADGDPVKITAKVSDIGVSLKNQLGLAYLGTYHTNYTGGQEKWLGGRNGSYFWILPSGELRRWAGTVPDTLRSENLIATLDRAFYDDPSLLWNAKAPATTVEIVGNQIRVARPTGFSGKIVIEVTVSDGLSTAKRYHIVSF